MKFLFVFIWLLLMALLPGPSSGSMTLKRMERKIERMERRYNEWIRRNTCKKGHRGPDGDCMKICSGGTVLTYEKPENNGGRVACCSPGEIVAANGACQKPKPNVPDFCYRLKAQLTIEGFFFRAFQGDYKGNTYRCDNEGCCSPSQNVEQVFEKCGYTVRVTTSGGCAKYQLLGSAITGKGTVDLILANFGRSIGGRGSEQQIREILEEEQTITEGGSEQTITEEGGSEQTITEEGGSEQTITEEGGSEQTITEEGGSEQTIQEIPEEEINMIATCIDGCIQPGSETLLRCNYRCFENLFPGETYETLFQEDVANFGKSALGNLEAPKQDQDVVFMNCAINKCLEIVQTENKSKLECILECFVPLLVKAEPVQNLLNRLSGSTVLSPSSPPNSAETSGSSKASGCVDGFMCGYPIGYASGFAVGISQRGRLFIKDIVPAGTIIPTGPMNYANSFAVAFSSTSKNGLGATEVNTDYKTGFSKGFRAGFANGFNMNIPL